MEGEVNPWPSLEKSFCAAPTQGICFEDSDVCMKGMRLVPKPLRVYISCNIGFRLCYVSPSNINTKGFLSSLASPALSETMQHWAGWVGVQGSIQSALSCCSSGLRGHPASLRTEGSTSDP